MPIMVQKPKTIGSIMVAVAAVLLITTGAFAYRSWKRSGEIVQPIAFNHQAHSDKAQIECSECHAHFSKGAHSGLPTSEVCMTCHADALTKSPEEEKLRRLVQEGRPVVFRKLFHLPSHVYYSHRRHVVLGKLECKQCHGEIAHTQIPPSRPLVAISMDFCTDCHKQAKVTNDCKSCHR